MELFPLGKSTGARAHPQKAVVALENVPAAYKAMQGAFYRWINRTGKQPTPGAEAMAFASLSLPLQDWKGPGEIVRQQLYLTAPQVYVQQMVVPTGMAGIAAGQVALASLMDNPYNSDAGMNG